MDLFLHLVSNGFRNLSNPSEEEKMFYNKIIKLSNCNNSNETFYSDIRLHRHEIVRIRTSLSQALPKFKLDEHGMTIRMFIDRRHPFLIDLLEGDDPTHNFEKLRVL